MRTVASFYTEATCFVLVCLVGAFALLATPAAAFAQSNDQATMVPEDASVQAMFRDFVHYARLGRFTAADAFAKALLEHSDLDPVEVLEAAEKDPKSLDTLLILIRSSSISERAKRVHELLIEGEVLRAKDSERIKANIEKLGGNPQQEFYAIENLKQSGEYAVPHMVDALLDPSQAKLKARIVRALPKIGKNAVNPLVMALQVNDDDVRLHVVGALGEIGYPQAYPYLSKLTLNADMPSASKKAASLAIARIEQISGRPIEGEASEQFFMLADKYYAEDDTVRANNTLGEANVWYWDEVNQTISATVVPTKLFGPVMAMRCCEEALLIQPDMIPASALWLASNIRRESRLGFDVESGDPEESAEFDPTRPDVFPRALYFTQAAGPLYAHLVLDRAVYDNDSAVALGAIAALRITAGEASLTGAEDYKQPLVQALQFPDLLVRIRAALALGGALPKSQFAGSQLVIPVLSNALSQTGSQYMVVVDPNEANRNRIAGALRQDGASVVAEADFFTAMNQARVEFPSISAIFVATDIAEPNLATAAAELRGEFAYSKTPVVVLVKAGQSLIADELATLDVYLETVLADVEDGMLTARIDAINERTGQLPLDGHIALSLALESAEVLRGIAADGRTVFRFERAEPALISVLTSPEEELQIKAASVLALAHTAAAQRAIAALALDAGNTTTLRVATFNSLAESAQNNGNLLEENQILRLVEIARDDEDLVIRTAASQALGAINLKSSKASEIIRKYYGG